MHGSELLTAGGWLAIIAVFVGVGVFVLRLRRSRLREFGALALKTAPPGDSPAATWVTPPFTPQERHYTRVGTLKGDVRRSDAAAVPLVYSRIGLNESRGGESTGITCELLSVRLTVKPVEPFLLASQRRPALHTVVWPASWSALAESAQLRVGADHVVTGSAAAIAAAGRPLVRAALHDMTDVGIGVTVFTASAVADGTGDVDLVAVVDGFSRSPLVVTHAARVLRALADELSSPRTE